MNDPLASVERLLLGDGSVLDAYGDDAEHEAVRLLLAVARSETRWDECEALAALLAFARQLEQA